MRQLARSDGLPVGAGFDPHRGRDAPARRPARPPEATLGDPDPPRGDATNLRPPRQLGRSDVAGRPLEGVGKRFGEVEAVAGVDLEIADGEFFSMLGPSGSGKTTTLRMIAGFELPTEGRVLLHGEDVTHEGAVRARRQHGLPGLRAVPAHDASATTSATA